MRSDAKVVTTSWRDRDGSNTATYAHAHGESPVELAVAGDMAGKIGAGQAIAHSSGNLSQEATALPGQRASDSRALPQR